MYPKNGNRPLDLCQFHALKGVADLIYNPLKTALILQAEELGVPCIGGLSMLVAQAKQAAEIFEDKTIGNELLEDVIREIAFLCTNIILIGMPGSGKSTIGKAIAQKLDRPFFDTDALIEKRAGKPIPQIFAEDGEERFRELESLVLSEFSAKSGVVIATGGGIIKKKENHAYMRQNGRIVFVERPLQALSTNGRPLSSSAEAVAKLYEERYPIYRMLADLTVQNTQTVEDAVETVCSQI